MLPLADLLELVFGPDLDPAGRQLVRDMRTLGRFGWLGGLLSRLLLPPAAAPRGFVWEEDGGLVGNASLLPVSLERWVLANVVVHPNYRRRGIGRELVEACMALARQRRIGMLMLQVKTDNLEAERLYRRLGFRSLGARTTWVRQAGAARAQRTGTDELRRGDAAPLGRPGTPEVRRRVSGEWNDQWSLAQRLYPEGLIWPNPLQPGAFRHGEARHWVWYRGAQLWGSLSALPRAGGWRLILLAQPEAAGQVEAALLGAALPALRGSLVLDYPAGTGSDALQGAGLRPERSLTWMERRLESTAAR
jgi:ribosomal protein S18 acetylase RimI-like enzyme